MSYFEAIWSCNTCDADLGLIAVHYNEGVCPRCGAVSSGGVVAATKRAVERVDKPNRLMTWLRSWREPTPRPRTPSDPPDQTPS